MVVHVRFVGEGGENCLGLLQVVVYDLLGTGVGVPVQIDVVHVTKVADPFGSDQVQQAVVVAGRSQMAHVER